MLHSAIMIVIAATTTTTTAICLIVCAVAIEIIIQDLIKLLYEIVITMQHQMDKQHTSTNVQH